MGTETVDHFLEKKKKKGYFPMTKSGINGFSPKKLEGKTHGKTED